ncbi:hypothetical protein AB0395_45420 [Streptosporangium sp. NPDC051023]|uniref:hypothetical protein n=1 Tax=Streptosporangium sp. NPDC051023 TaxID=3155410 RepID=UPI00344B16EC
MPPDAGAVRAARALRNYYLRAIEERDLKALIDNLADWMSIDLDVRAAVLSAEREIS